jgi:hypothetical protein
MAPIKAISPCANAREENANLHVARSGEKKTKWLYQYHAGWTAHVLADQLPWAKWM